MKSSWPTWPQVWHQTCCRPCTPAPRPSARAPAHSHRRSNGCVSFSVAQADPGLDDGGAGDEDLAESDLDELLEGEGLEEEDEDEAIAAEHGGAAAARMPDA
jgi:hypothetical protein